MNITVYDVYYCCDGFFNFLVSCDDDEFFDYFFCDDGIEVAVDVKKTFFEVRYIRQY